MKFLIELEKDIEFTDEILPANGFIVAYKAPYKTYIIIDFNNEEDLLKLVKQLNATGVYPVQEIKKLNKVVYERGYRKIIPPE